MSISRRTDSENYLWVDLPEPTSLTPAIASQIVSAIVAGDPKRADELADLLLTLEQELSNAQDSIVDGVIENIDKLVELAFRESEPYKDYLDVYRMTVNQRCRRRPPSDDTPPMGTRLLRQDPDMQRLIFMVIRPAKRRGGPN
jgi:hypothetical protein